MFPTSFTLTLLRHPATPAPVVRLLEVHAGLGADGDLELAWCLRGDMARLLIPATRPPGRVDGLWEHTCFEVFIGVAGDPAYREFNLSPSGQWAAYAFSGYRQRDETQALLAPPQISARLSAGRLELEATIAPAVLPTAPAGKTLHLGLAAVVEATDTIDGGHSYWALRHPAALPDFHHRDGFAFELATPQAAV